jgi:hypothetical protein
MGGRMTASGRKAATLACSAKKGKIMGYFNDIRVSGFTLNDAPLAYKTANNLSELPVRRDIEVAASMRSM